MKNKTPWHSFRIYGNQIDVWTDKAVKIKVPHRSEYDGFVFWISQKLLKPNGYMYEVVYKDGMTFSLKKYGETRSTCRTVVREVEVDGDELSRLFANQNEERETIHVPEKIEAIEAAEPLEELIDE